MENMKKECGEQEREAEKTATLENYQQVLQTLSENTDDYPYIWEIERKRCWFFGKVNEKYDLFKTYPQYCTMQDWEKIVYPRDLPELLKDLAKVRHGESLIHDIEYRLIDRQGNSVWVSSRGTVIETKDGQPSIMIGRVSDTVLCYKVDELTGMFNLVKLKEDMSAVFCEKQSGFLLLLEIDNFKDINIQHGYERGNRELLYLKDVIEETAISRKIYHVEKDRFALWPPNISQDEVKALYENIQKEVSPAFTISGGALDVSVISEQNVENFYQYAEYVLDKAKEDGKNRLRFFSHEEYQEELQRVELQEELRNSVEQDCQGFFLCYQPQVKAGSYQMFGAEALLRYHSKTRGNVMPNEFIPILEETGLICKVGLWVLKTALEQCRKWRIKMPDFHISVNVSYIQLMQKDLTEQVTEILAESGVAGEALTLEITESMQLQNLAYYNKIFSAWKREGITISLDDFGTGYSGLAYLKYLDVDEIKIDRCFVKDIQNSRYDYRLLSSMLELVAGSDIQVCCEGVEKKEELHLLETLSPDLLQGYFFSKPCEPEQIEKLYFSAEEVKNQKSRSLCRAAAE